MKNCPFGRPQSGTVRFEKKYFFTLNSNIAWFLKDRGIFLFLKKEIWSISIMMKISMLRFVYPPLRPPQKDHDFDGFLHFLEKLERSLGTIFWFIIENDWNNFSSTFKGITYNVPLEKLKKDQKMLTFWIFIKSKN